MLWKRNRRRSVLAYKPVHFLKLYAYSRLSPPAYAAQYLTLGTQGTSKEWNNTYGEMNLKDSSFIWKASAVAVIFVSFMSASFAAESDESDKENSNWTGYIATTYQNNWADDYRNEPQVDIDLKVGYEFTDDFSAGVITGAYYLDTRYCSTHTKDYWCASPTYLYSKFSDIYKLGDFASIDLKGNVLLPTTQYAQDTHLYFGLVLATPLDIEVDRYIDGLDLVFTPSITKYFNKYKTAGNTNLTEYTFSLGLSSSYQITDKLTFTFSALNSHYVTYKGDTLYPSISHSEELGYDINDDLYVGIGYSNNAQFYNPDRGPNPISGLFDDKDPHYYLTFSYSL